MTFDELKAAVKGAVNLTSQEADTRVGASINRHYRRVTSLLGMDATRFVTRSETTTPGVRTVTFTSIEKIDRILDTTDSTAIRLLQEVSTHHQRSMQPGTGQPCSWAFQNTDTTAVTVLLDTLPQTAYSLQADGWTSLADLTTSDSPAFPESFHDILVWFVIAEELLRKEKDRIAANYDAKAEKLLADLRFHIADSHTRDTRQADARLSPLTNSASGGGGGTLGGTAYTQTALETFDRGAGLAPFAVAEADAATVANLDADKLDGEDGTFYLDLANHVGAPPAHASSHQNGGADEISVTGLSGLLADGQTPLAHATSHASAGSDPIKLDDLAAPDDTTDLNSSTSAHGLLKKLSNTATEFMNGVGAWATPTITEQTSSATGAQNDISLNARQTHLRCTGAAPIFTGFTVGGSAPTAGDSVLITNAGSGTVQVASQDSGSTAANRAIATSTRGQILGVGGSMRLTYDGTDSRWRIAVLDPGAPISVTFSAGNFTASAGTWTVASGDQTVFTYRQHGKVVDFVITLSTTSVSSVTTGTLRITLPNSFTAAKAARFGCMVYNNNSDENAEVKLTAASGTMNLRNSGGSLGSGSWADCTDLTYIFFNAALEVE